jgi:hypothetical protein
MKATSTSTAGIEAPTSTRNGACLTPRPSLPVTTASSSWIRDASAEDSSRCSACAMSQRINERSESTGVSVPGGTISPSSWAIRRLSSSEA